LQDITNQNVLPASQKSLPFWLKRALKSSWCALEIPICLSKRINPSVDQILEQGILATQQKTSSRPDTGRVKRGSAMKAEEVLKLLEKHEEECNRRYADIQKQLDKLDLRLWGIAVLIIAVAFAQRLF